MCSVEPQLAGTWWDKGMMKEMVDAIRTAEKALGKVSYEITEKEKESRIFRRSLFVVKDVKEGEEFTEENIRSIRPGHGLHTRYLDKIIGKLASMDLKGCTPLDWQHIKWHQCKKTE